jgi:hypothetical protein
MDLYLPDEFYALSEAPNARSRATTTRAESEWLGGEAFVAPAAALAVHATEPDPIWRVV